MKSQRLIPTQERKLSLHIQDVHGHMIEERTYDQVIIQEFDGPSINMNNVMSPKIKQKVNIPRLHLWITKIQNIFKSLDL